MKIVKTLSILAGIAFTVSCNESSISTNETSNDTTKSDTMKAMIPESACYENTTGKDSFFMKMEVFPNVVTGKLDYDFSEKDKNTGEFDGVLKGDTLLADYTFKSEGVSSVRQVAFLLRDSSVIEGYGPMKEKDGKMVFTDLSKLNFSGTPLIKVPCGER
jgi:hypothetical protein